MSHSFTATIGPNAEILFICNPDLIGDAEIRLVHKGVVTDPVILIPCSAVVAFVADYVARQRIAQLKNMSAESVLGIE